ncbi:hypothetical protein EP30_10955 [Bifidobacterium sp. UTCIF-39]|uniref:hypothetical protein n=1 Tax=Bifidobacterium sp. UTCIF-39 TaxID=1465359 RepID=UPI002159B540|nr:hypothetical protein [Bifidobacterium sp. UTCIF-39]TPF95334.1 hypothetical protein EP30_10955 [Bifidobacterium sp. UTCIF-39]
MADPTMNRQSGGLDLTPETQAQIWQTATYQSAFMQLVPQINLPGKGVRVPIITGDPEADWVQEGAEKPKSGVGGSSPRVRGKRYRHADDKGMSDEELIRCIKRSRRFKDGMVYIIGKDGQLRRIR